MSEHGATDWPMACLPGEPGEAGLGFALLAR